jgi:tRNA-2-methylthio-N6-dimethylallyladenosine synthase
MTPDILSAHFELPKMCHYLHFALQSGSNDVLKTMNRKHTFEDFKTQVDYLRSHNPLFSISTDIIVGFPGETEAQFEETVRAFELCEFDFAFIARYSPRSGTYATDYMKETVSMKEKARRWDILNSLLFESVQKRNALMIGRTEEILIRAQEKDEQLVGRTRNFKEVYIEDNGKIQIGDIIQVHITESDRWVLRGKIIN